MALRSQLKFVRALIAINLRASVALRGAFLLQASFMVANNLIFFSIWWIFFRRFPEVGGWRLADVSALFGLVAAGFGLSMVFAGGVRNLARFIDEGELDAFLTQPKSVLVHVLGSSSSASGWGDLVTGLFLVGMSGYAAPGRVPLIGLLIVCAALLFLSSGVAIHCLAFWLADMDSLARQLMEFVIIFSTYPQSIFGGWLKVLLFTLIPAGFIGYLPVELLRDFHWSRLLALLAAVSVYAAIAVALFRTGLRRYESGNRFGARG